MKDRTHLDAKVASIHVVAQEEVRRIRRAAPDLEQLHQVVLWLVSLRRLWLQKNTHIGRGCHRKLHTGW
jgi:hypothetical protein